MYNDELILSKKDSLNYIGLYRTINNIKDPNYKANRPESERPTTAFKLKILHKQNYQCYDCQKVFNCKGNNYKDSTIEHVIPYKFGGKLSNHNCVILCMTCNQKRTHMNILDIIEDHYGKVDCTSIYDIALLRLKYMSIQLYPISALRTWNEDEIEYREFIIKRLKNLLFNKLSNINSAWKFYRCETPSLIPLSDVSKEYDNSDLFLLQNPLGKDTSAVMRPETTQGSYHYANYIIGKGNQRSLKKLPLCVWQAGQSHRRETNDGATARELRFNQFWQLEFQCIYRNNTLADYRDAIEIPLAVELGYLCRKDTHIVESDRLPSYSKNTQDIEAFYNNKWKEICSISTRTDFSEDCEVLEIAIGLDRVVEISKIGA